MTPQQTIPPEGQNQVATGTTTEQSSTAGEEAESKQSRHFRWQHFRCSTVPAVHLV